LSVLLPLLPTLFPTTAAPGCPCLLLHCTAVAQWLFFPDLVAAGIPHRLLLQLWPGASKCRARQ
jgi:hypothetical protein